MIKRTFTYIIPDFRYQYKSAQSAGSNSLLLSGFKSRICIIVRGTFPEYLIAPTIRKLMFKYEDVGFSKEVLVTTANSMLKTLKKTWRFPEKIYSFLYVKLFDFQQK